MVRLLISLTCAALCLSLAGCWTQPVVRVVDLPRDRVEIAKVEPKRFAEATEFAWDATRAVHTPGRGWCFSPFGVDQVLLMLLNGAEGETYDTLAKGLRIGDGSLEKTNQARMATLDAIRALPGEPVLNASSLWTVQPAPLHPTYREEMLRYFGAEARKLGSAGRDAVRQVNEWVSVQTKGRITGLFESLSPNDVLIVVSTTVLDATWELPFEPGKSMAFRSPSGTRSIPALVDERTVDFAEGATWTAIRIPYRAPNLGLVVVLPKTGDVDQLVRGMNGAAWGRLIQSLESRDVKLQVPKFELRSRFALNEPLAGMGMGELFKTVNTFPRISLELATDAAVTQFVQQAVIKVDERGTQAAAATGAAAAGGMPLPTERKEFVADRPFLFAVVERTSGALLFVGCVVEPGTSE